MCFTVILPQLTEKANNPPLLKPEQLTKSG